MSVADTELLFLLNPRDPRHRYALDILETIRNLVVPDVALPELELVLRTRGCSLDQIYLAMKAIKKILSNYGVEERSFISTELMLIHLDLEKGYGLSFFDSLIAASVMLYDKKVVLDDTAFDRVLGLERIAITHNRSDTHQLGC